MADVSAHTPIFSRGSTVLDYWLAHAEGLTIQPLGARVEEVVVVAPVGRAESLVVRSRLTRRRRTIPADAIAAVAPSTGDLLLDPPEPRAPFRVPRPSPERIAAARGIRRRLGAAHASRDALRRRLAASACRACRRGDCALRTPGCRRRRSGSRVAGPRIAEFAQLTVAGAVLVARGTVHAARQVERATVAGVGRGRAVARSAARTPAAQRRATDPAMLFEPDSHEAPAGRAVGRGARSGRDPQRSSLTPKRRSTTAGPTIRWTARPTGCARSTWAARESWMRSAACAQPAWSSCSGTTSRTSSTRPRRRPTSTTRAPSAVSGWARSASGWCCSVCRRRRRTWSGSAS